MTSSPSRSHSTTLRTIVVAGAIASSLVLAGCSQVPGFVTEILPERSGVHTLVTGDCFDNTERIVPNTEIPIDVPRANCTLAHDNEVITSIQLDDATYPGEDAAATRALEACLPEFESFIGASAAESGTFEYGYFAPSAASWKLGDREMLCYAYDSAAQTAYSLKGAGAKLAEAPAPDATTEVTP